MIENKKKPAAARKEEAARIRRIKNGHHLIPKRKGGPKYPIPIPRRRKKKVVGLP